MRWLLWIICWPLSLSQSWATAAPTPQPTVVTSALPHHNLAHWHHLPTDHRQHLIKQYHHLQQLPKHERAELQHKWQRFQSLPSNQQQQLRQLWQQLSLSERQAWLNRLQHTPARQRAVLRATLMQQLKLRQQLTLATPHLPHHLSNQHQQ